MKQCSYCGKEYPDDVVACAIDGQPLTRGAAPTSSFQVPVDSSPPIPARAPATAREVAEKNMLVGGLWCVGGIIVTVLTYAAAASSPTGGSYFVAWGAIIFGAVQFFRGLSALPGKNENSSSPAPVQSAEPVMPLAPGMWKCRICGEISEDRYAICWKCQTPHDDTSRPEQPA